MSSTSPPVRYYVGLDAHHDTISACVYDADKKREQMRTSRRVSLGLWNLRVQSMGITAVVMRHPFRVLCSMTRRGWRHCQVLR